MSKAKTLPTELYHATAIENLKSIVEHGLEPRKPSDINTQPQAVYFSEFPFEWIDRATVYGQKKGVVIKVNVQGLELYDDTSTVVSLARGIKVHRGFYTKRIVEPKRFVEIMVEQKNRSFKTLTNKFIL